MPCQRVRPGVAQHKGLMVGRQPARHCLGDDLLGLAPDKPAILFRWHALGPDAGRGAYGTGSRPGS